MYRPAIMGVFLVVVCFLFNDGSEGAYLLLCHADGFRFIEPFPIPELLMFFLHPFEEILYAHVPIYLVGFGYEKAGYCRFAVSQPLLEQRVIYHSGYFGGINHQLFPYVTRQSVQSAYASDGQVHGGLVSSVETVEYMVNVLAGTYRIAPGVDVAGVIAPLGHPFETVETIGLSLCFYLIVYGVCRIVAVDVDIKLSFADEIAE